MSKSPYEIRLELLQLASSVLTNRTVYNVGNELTNYEPTFEEIMKEAEKLNMFVSVGLCECEKCDCNPCTCLDGGDCGC